MVNRGFSWALVIGVVFELTLYRITSGQFSKICTTDANEVCIVLASSPANAIELSNSSLSHLVWTTDGDFVTGNASIVVNGTNDCLAPSDPPELETCSASSNVWELATGAVASEIGIVAETLLGCKRLAQGVDLTLVMVNCSEVNLESSWSFDTSVLTPTASPANSPVESPEGPKPFEPFSTPFRIIYQSAFIILGVGIVYLILWKFECLPSWLPTPIDCKECCRCEGRSNERKSSLNLI